MRIVLFLACYIPVQAFAQTVGVSTAGSRLPSEFHGDGICDQKEINLAIAALPEAGGTVKLAEGVYDICAEEGAYGGVIVERSNLRIVGEGAGTVLRLAAGQNTNVIRIKGSVENIAIEYLRVDGNRDGNPECNGAQPVVPHSRFECTGIKAHYLTPENYRTKEVAGEHIKNVRVTNVRVENANSINVMLSGEFMYILDSYIGDARSDAVEILHGPGQIIRNTLVVDAETGYGLSTDAANDVQINDNLVIVKASGKISQSAIRTWTGFLRNQVNDNLVTIEGGASVGRILELNATDSMDSNNLISELPLIK